MEIVPNLIKDNFSRPQIEQLQQKQHEYYLLGSYWLSKGLKLFSYNPTNSELKEVKIVYSDTITIYKIDGILVTIDLETTKCTVDSRNYYFESLNMNTAKNRVEKFKNGKIKELFNLRNKPNKTIKLF